MGTFHKIKSTDLEIGLITISNIFVKYRSELDRKVRFSDLQNAIDDINNRGMTVNDIRYDRAAIKMKKVTLFNRTARRNYEEGVALIFEWCVRAIGKFDIILSHINSKSLSSMDIDMIWAVTVNTLNEGLEKTLVSLELLNDSHLMVCELKNLLDSVLHDLHDDFGSNGFYGNKKRYLKGLIEEKYNLQIRSYQKQIDDLETLFKRSTNSVQNCKQVVVNGIDLQLDEDIKNLRSLRGKAYSANNSKSLLEAESFEIRAIFGSALKSLNDECRKYIEWHGSSK